jgi:hypothetical protein
MAKATVDTNNMCLYAEVLLPSSNPRAQKVSQSPVSLTVLPDAEAEALGLSQPHGGLGPLGRASRTAPAGKQSDVAKDSLTQAAEGQGGPRSSFGQFPNGRADTAGKGGPFGNEHDNKSYPDAVTGD